MDEPNKPNEPTPANVLTEIVRLNKVPSIQRQQAKETKMQDQEAARRLAGQYGPEMLLKLVSIVRTSSDEKNVIKCIGMLLDRWVGSPKPPTEEEKKGADGGSLLDILAAVSVKNNNLELTIRNERLNKSEEKDITPTDPLLINDIEGFFEEVDGD